MSRSSSISSIVQSRQLQNILIKHAVPFAGNDRGPPVFYGPYDSPDENYNDWPAAARQYIS